LPGIHKNPFTRPRKIGGAARAIDQKEPVWKVWRFDPDLVIEDTELAGGRGRPIMRSGTDEIGRKLLRLRGRGSTAKGAYDAKQAQP
jgi:hypothetical protein